MGMANPVHWPSRAYRVALWNKYDGKPGRLLHFRFVLLFHAYLVLPIVSNEQRD